MSLLHVVTATSSLGLHRCEFSLVLFQQDVLLAAKRGLIPIDVAADQLNAATTEFLTLHQVAYGTAYLKPKHHWLLDLPSQLRRDRMILDAFVIERQHLMVKAVAEPIRNTSTFEASVLASLVNVQIRCVRELKLGSSLIGRTRPLVDVPGVVVSDKMTIHNFTVAVDDIIMRGVEVAAVVACAEQGSHLFAFVAPLNKVAQVTRQAAKYRRAPMLAVWRALDVQQCLAWKDEADGTVMVLAR